MSLTLDGTNGISASGGVNVLQDDSVVTGNLVDSAVTTDKIANDAVTTAKIGNSQVTDAKVAGIAASKITSGTVAVARLGTGTPGTGNFLRGDGSWQAIPASAPSTTDVLNATAGATAGAVGTYAFLGTKPEPFSNAFGGTRAGSELEPAGVVSTTTSFTGNLRGALSGSVSGTWRCMGFSNATSSLQGGGPLQAGTVWLRIS